MLLQLHVAAYWSVLLHTSKIVNYGSDSFEIQYGDGLWALQNIRGVLPQKCSILLHTAAHCCILAKIAAYHKTPLKKQ